MEQPIYSSSELIANNGDLLSQILINLSEKPLSRFKTVSKFWLNVISDPDFSIRWTRKHTPFASALFFRRDPPIGTEKYLFIPLDGQEQLSRLPFYSLPVAGTKIYQSCNGLLLLGGFGCDDYVYNPTTKQLKHIPLPPRSYLGFISYNLVFDPLKSHHFKLLGVSTRKDILIYSSETACWRVLSDDSLKTNNRAYDDDIYFSLGVFMNGAIHWPCIRKSTSLYYDVDKECCRTMPMPPIQGGWGVRNIRYFGESQRRLHMIEYENDLTLSFDVFEMAMDYSNWFVKYNVNLASLGWCINPVGCLILSLVEDEEGSLVLVTYIPDLELVVSYNLKNEKLKNCYHLSLTRSDVDNLKSKKWIIVHQFIKSPVEF